MAWPVLMTVCAKQSFMHSVGSTNISWYIPFDDPAVVSCFCSSVPPEDVYLRACSVWRTVSSTSPLDLQVLALIDVIPRAGIANVLKLTILELLDVTQCTGVANT